MSKGAVHRAKAREIEAEARHQAGIAKRMALITGDCEYCGAELRKGEACDKHCAEYRASLGVAV
jgi:hypothetical protein